MRLKTEVERTEKIINKVFSKFAICENLFINKDNKVKAKKLINKLSREQNISENYVLRILKISELN